MMQSGLLVQPSWPTQSYFDSILDQDCLNMDFHTSEDRDYPSPVTTTTEHSSPILCLSNSDMFPGDHMQNHSPVNMEGFEDVCRWLCEDDQQMEEIPRDGSSEGSYVLSPSVSMNSSEACPYVSYERQSFMEIESETGIQNLLEAYADATGLGQRELANVIQKCISEKASPIGPALERLALNLFRCEGQEYLKQESMRSFKPAFRAFYEIFPYGRFAHFTSSSAILDAVPTHVNSVHIVDFDMGEGTQWPPVIEAIAQRRKSLTITSVKLEEHDSGFEETKRHLFNYARSFGLNLKVEEMELAQMVKGMEGREFVAFNCMVGLPHMGRTRRRGQILEFLKIAKGLLAKNEGILTFGDGEDGDRMANSSNYTSFFGGNMAHYKALYESMEWGFPNYLTEGRIAMETLFVAPFISSISWYQKWEEGREDMVLRKDLGLKGRKISRESSDEVKELVKEGESPYKIRIEGDNENEMVLEWRGTPLVRVSAWM